MERIEFNLLKAQIEAQIKEIKKICHVIAPACIPEKLSLYKREELARKSYEVALSNHDGEIIQLAVTDSEFEYKNIKNKNIYAPDEKLKYLTNLIKNRKK